MRRNAEVEIGVLAFEAEGNRRRQTPGFRLRDQRRGYRDPDTGQDRGRREADEGRCGVHALLVVHCADEQGVHLKAAFATFGIARETANVRRDQERGVGGGGEMPGVDRVTGDGIEGQGIGDIDAVEAVVTDLPLEASDATVRVISGPEEIDGETRFEQIGRSTGDLRLRQGVGYRHTCDIGFGHATAQPNGEGRSQQNRQYHEITSRKHRSFLLCPEGQPPGRSRRTKLVFG